MGKIPDYIVNEETREKLAEINEHLRTLQQWHKKLIDKAAEGTLSQEESQLLRDIIKSYNNLQKQFQELAPSLVDIVKKFK